VAKLDPRPGDLPDGWIAVTCLERGAVKTSGSVESTNTYHVWLCIWELFEADDDPLYGFIGVICDVQSAVIKMTELMPIIGPDDNKVFRERLKSKAGGRLISDQSRKAPRDEVEVNLRGRLLRLKLPRQDYRIDT